MNVWSQDIDANIASREGSGISYISCLGQYSGGASRRPWRLLWRGLASPPGDQYGRYAACSGFWGDWSSAVAMASATLSAAALTGPVLRWA